MFAYTIKLNQTQMLKAEAADSDYQLFYRMDISDDEMILEPVKEIKKIGEDTKAIRNNVKAALNGLRVDTSTLTAKATVSYDRIEARDYALDHATDTPEFSKANKQGSDVIVRILFLSQLTPEAFLLTNQESGIQAVTEQ